MKQISLREFQLHPTQYLKDLPIVLTQYNKPVASIIPHVNTSVNKNVQSANYPRPFIGSQKTVQGYQVLVTPPTETTDEQKLGTSEGVSKYPTHYLGKPLSGRKASCPICYESVPVEFAQQHYSKQHPDI